MFLDYSKLPFDKDNIPEKPALVLKTLDGKTIGPIPGVYNLKLNIKFAEPSEIRFDVPAYLDGEPNPLYEAISGHKQVYTEHYGVFETMNPSTEADGIREVKHVKGYSLEKTLKSKKFFLEEGTYDFWNPASPKDTVLELALKSAPGWRVGYVSPALIGKYRTFDGYNDYLLSFLYNHAPQKYNCVIVFDVYQKTVNAYDAEEELENLPIYLDFDNLVKSVDIEEVSDELVTALRPYGADELSILNVNPTGSPWLYDLSFFLENGDIGAGLGKKWEAWQSKALARREYYRGLTALEASATAQLLAAKAKLNDLNGPEGELDSLLAQQSITIQTLAKEKTQAGKDSQQKLLDDINRQIAGVKQSIQQQERNIEAIEKELDPEEPSSYTAQIAAIVKELSLAENFTAEEREELSHYFIERDLTEDTFAATDVDTTVSGQFLPMKDEGAAITGSSITEERGLREDFGKTIYTMAGGRFSLHAGKEVSGDIIRGVLDTEADGTFHLSLYAGSIRAGDKTAQSGMIAVSGSMSGLGGNIQAVTKDDITVYEGSSLSFTVTEGNAYLTANVSDYQRYAVETELYEYAAGVLHELATPTYEFSVDSGNFIFAKEFAPFRERLELGKGVYLNVGHKQLITPYIIEFELDFERREKFSIIFSNRFKRHDNVNTLKEIIETSYSSARSFDAAKYLYNQTAGQATAVSRFMSSSLDAAKNHVLSAKAQVSMDGAGLHIGGDGGDQIRMTGSMIAMTDNNWETAKLAIGRFASPELGEYWGVNADILAGVVHIGNMTILENQQYDAKGQPTGVMQFKVDATGAWLNNSTMVLQQDGGGRILLDPKYGIVAGTKDLFDTDGTTVLPGFIGKDGKIDFDEDGMPRNSNFFLDLRDGSAYFRGNGEFNGIVHASGGEFDGVVKARDFMLPSGDSMVSVLNNDKKIKSDWLDLLGINIKDAAGNTMMTIDGTKGITINKGSISWGAVTGTDEIDQRIQDAKDAADDAYSEASSVNDNLLKLVQGKYTTPKSTFIDGTTVKSPTIEAGTITGAEIYGSDIYGGAFYDLNGKSKLVLNPSNTYNNYADLVLYGGGDGRTAAFCIYDTFGGVELSGYGVSAMIISKATRRTHAQGTWDFSNATVTGITAVFA